jgi:hypothetical protein
MGIICESLQGRGVEIFWRGGFTENRVLFLWGDESKEITA